MARRFKVALLDKDGNVTYEAGDALVELLTRPTESKSD
jgi:hypothetical protein